MTRPVPEAVFSLPPRRQRSQVGEDASVEIKAALIRSWVQSLTLAPRIQGHISARLYVAPSGEAGAQIRSGLLHSECDRTLCRWGARGAGAGYGHGVVARGGAGIAGGRSSAATVVTAAAARHHTTRQDDGEDEQAEHGTAPEWQRTGGKPKPRRLWCTSGLFGVEDMRARQ